MRFNSKMLSAAAAAALIVTMAGCESTATSSSKTGGSAQHITNPKGSVTGTVQDTNGNPLTGVLVYLAGQRSKTDAGGVYRFSSVPVTQVNDTASGAHGQDLSVTIAAPEGYIGATVIVRPAAQIDNAENAENGVETFIDGFIASAGVAVLPETNSTVVGVLRDIATGAPLANTEIQLEFIAGGSGADVAQEQSQNGIDTSYAVSTYKISTDVNGSFSFTSLPTDSTFQFLVPGYDNVDVGGATDLFASDAETVVTLGNVVAKEIKALDTTPPFVVSVDNIISAPAALRATLDDDTRDTFVVNFSETLTPEKLELAGNSVFLYAGEDGNMTKRAFTAAINSDNNAVTFTITDALADGDLVDLLFLNADTVDTSMNSLTTAGTVIGYDAPQGNYTKIKLEIFSEENQAAAAATSQTQMTKDNSGVDDDEALQAVSSAYNDVLDNDIITGFQQLNSADNDTGLVNDAQERLTALVNEQKAGAFVQTDKTRISFVANDAFTYQISVTDQTMTVDKVQADVDGVLNATSVNTKIEGDFSDTIPGNMLEISTDANETVEVYLSNVEPTDIVTITPVDSLGYAGTPVVIQLVDNVAPTTVLQKSYLNGTPTIANTGTTVQFGDGGELSQNFSDENIGAPYISVNPGLLDNLDGNGENVNNGATRDKKLQEELFVYNTMDTTVNPAAYYIDKADGIYDAHAITQMTDFSRQIGVAFSEDINVTGDPVLTNISATVNNAKAFNDVTANVDGGIINSDLVTLEVNNVMTLANDDNMGVIDFSTVVTDTAETPNAATNANAKVVVLDQMPPLVTKAFFDGTNVVVTFNEAISLRDTMTLTIDDTAGVGSSTATYNATTSPAAWTLSVDAKTLTIAKSEFPTAGGLTINDSEDWYNNAPVSKVYYTYGVADPYSVSALGDTNLTHATLDFSDIPDSHDYSWADYATDTLLRAVATPEFAIVNTVTNNLFNITGSDSTAFKVSDDTTTTQQVVKWTFSHPIRVDGLTDIFNDANLDGGAAETDGRRVITDAIAAAAPNASDNVVNYFEAVVGGGTEALTNQDTTSASTTTSLELSANRKVVTLKFTTATNVAATTDSVKLKAGLAFVSEYDYSKTHTDATVTANPVP